MAPCSHCAAPNASKVCGRCLDEAYCNVDCQRDAWKAGHKGKCKKPLHSHIPKDVHEKVSTKQAKDIMGDSIVVNMAEQGEYEGGYMSFDRRGLEEELKTMRAVSEHWLLPMGHDAKPVPLFGELSRDDVGKALDAAQKGLVDRVVQTAVPGVKVRYFYDDEAPEGDGLNPNTLQLSGSTFDIPVVMRFVAE